MNIIEIPSDHEMFSKEFSGEIDNFIYDEFGIILKTNNKIDIGMYVFFEKGFIGTQICLAVLNNKAVEYVYYDIYLSDKNNDGMEVMCSKNESRYLNIGHDLAQLVLRIILYIMTTLRKREKIEKFKLPNEVRENVNIENKKKPSVEHKIYLLDEIIDYATEEVHTLHSSATHKINCPCWSVRGHFRHYKSGKVIFVKDYKKGKKRDKMKPIDKTYII